MNTPIVIQYKFIIAPFVEENWKIDMNIYKIFMVALWVAVTLPLIGFLFGALSAPSTLGNVISFLTIVGWVLVSIDTKCFTNFIKTKKTNE